MAISPIKQTSSAILIFIPLMTSVLSELFLAGGRSCKASSSCFLISPLILARDVLFCAKDFIESFFEVAQGILNL